MSANEMILWLALIALLGIYWRMKHRQSLRSQSEPCDPKWTGKAIDVASLKPGMDYGRRDCLAARQPVKGICFHRALIELARQAAARLAYFHDREPEDHVQTHSSSL
jgi:hypothetical protein